MTRGYKELVQSSESANMKIVDGLRKSFESMGYNEYMTVGYKEEVFEITVLLSNQDGGSVVIKAPQSQDDGSTIIVIPNGIASARLLRRFDIDSNTEMEGWA